MAERGKKMSKRKALGTFLKSVEQARFHLASIHTAIRYYARWVSDGTAGRPPFDFEYEYELASESIPPDWELERQSKDSESFRTGITRLRELSDQAEPHAPHALEMIANACGTPRSRYLQDHGHSSAHAMFWTLIRWCSDFDPQLIEHIWNYFNDAMVWHEEWPGAATACSEIDYVLGDIDPPASNSFWIGELVSERTKSLRAERKRQTRRKSAERAVTKGPTVPSERRVYGDWWFGKRYIGHRDKMIKMPHQQGLIIELLVNAKGRPVHIRHIQAFLQACKPPWKEKPYKASSLNQVRALISGVRNKWRQDKAWKGYTIESGETDEAEKRLVFPSPRNSTK